MDSIKDINIANCKEFLVKRMFFAIGSSIIVHFILTSGVILVSNLKLTHPLEWIQDTWNVITCLRMWTYFFIFSTLVFFQGIICSKDYMNPISYASSRFIKFYQIFTLHNLLKCSLYIALGGVLAWLHLSVEGGKYGSLTYYCEKLQGSCLVEEHYFLLLEGFWIGLYFFIRSNSMGLRNLKFSIIPQSKLSQVKRGIREMIPKALLNALWPMIYFVGFYSIFGSYCRNLFLTTFFLSFEEIPLDKISRLLSLSLIFYAWLHAVLFSLIIQSMHLLFQAYLTEWVPFEVEKTQSITKTKVSLPEALGMEKFPILQQLGYLDLVTVAQKDQNRRMTLFTLSQPGGHPYNWNKIVERSLSLIKNFSEALDSACSTQTEQFKLTVPITANQTLDRSNYTYHMRNLASPAVSENSEKNQEHNSKQVTSILHNNLKNLKTSIINLLLSIRFISYIFGEQFENKLKYILNNGQAVIWATDSISLLASISLTEDRYGIVQKDLSEIIEVLLKLKQALDKLQKLNISIRKPMSEDKFLKQNLVALRSAVRRSLYRIISHFKKYIDDLALSVSTVDQLTPFFTFRE